MSNRRSIVWLTLGIVLLVGAHFMLTYCGAPDSRIVRRVTLADSHTHYSSIELKRADGSVVKLLKSSVWQLVEPFAARVDARPVLKLLDALSFTTIDDALSDAELLRMGRTRADFGLVKPRLSVTLMSESLTERISFGDCTPSTNGVYAAIEGLDSVFVVPMGVVTAVDVPTDSFRSRSLFAVGPESVMAFDIKRGGGSLLSFTRDGERWKVDESTAAASPKVRALLSGVLSASAAGFVWPVGATNEARSATASLLAVYELDPESAVTVTLKCVDGIDRQLSFGGDADEGRVYALVQDGSAIVTLDAKLREMAAQDAVMFTDSRLFPYEASSVKSFSLVDGETSYAVARGDEGVWRLDAPVVASADAATVQAILDKVLSLSSLDVRSEGLKVSVTTNSAPVTVSRQSVLGRVRLEDLRSKEILKIEPVLVKRIVRIPGEAGGKPSSVVYARDRRVWNADAGSAEGSVSEKGVLAVLEALNPLRASRIEKLKVAADDLARFGLETPHLTVAIDQDREDSVRRNIIIGTRTEGGRFATVGSADAVFVLPDATVDRLCSQIMVK